MGGEQFGRLLCYHFALELQVIYFYVFSTHQEAKARDMQNRLVPIYQVSWANRLFFQP